MSAEPKTLEIIFKLKALNIDSEVQLMVALERYIKHNQKEDREIVEKVRPALNRIRFLTLSPKLVSQTSLLDPEDVLTVIGCLPPDGDVSKMPSSLSINIKQRQLPVSDMQMVRNLSEVYSSKLCFLCGTNAHTIWDCSRALDQPRRTILKNIFDKYKHVWLMEYNQDDLKTVYDIYKGAKWVQ